MTPDTERNLGLSSHKSYRDSCKVYLDEFNLDYRSADQAERRFSLIWSYWHLHQGNFDSVTEAQDALAQYGQSRSELITWDTKYDENVSSSLGSIFRNIMNRAAALPAGRDGFSVKEMLQKPNPATAALYYDEALHVLHTAGKIASFRKAMEIAFSANPARAVIHKSLLPALLPNVNDKPIRTSKKALLDKLTVPIEDDYRGESEDKVDAVLSIDKKQRLIDGLDKLRTYVAQQHGYYDKLREQRTPFDRALTRNFRQLQTVERYTQFLADSLGSDVAPVGFFLLPTGYGKTKVVDDILKITGWQAKWLTPTNVLIDQTTEALADDDSEIDHGLATYHGAVVRDEEHMVPYEQSPYDVVILDEVHKILGDKIHDVVDAYIAGGYPILGLTATESYSENRDVTDVLGDPIDVVSTIDAIRLGVLPSLLCVEVEACITDTGKVVRRLSPEMFALLIAHIYKQAFASDGERGMITANRVEDCKTIADVLNKELDGHHAFSYAAMPYWGQMGTQADNAQFRHNYPLFYQWANNSKQGYDLYNTPKNLQKAVLAYSKQGHVGFLTSVKALAEGYDDVGISLLFGYPTESTVRSRQNGGRALRWNPDDRGRITTVFDVLLIDKKNRLLDKKQVPYAEALRVQQEQFGESTMLTDDLTYQPDIPDSGVVETSDGITASFYTVLTARVANPFDTQEAYSDSLSTESPLRFSVIDSIRKFFGDEFVRYYVEFAQPLLYEERRKNGLRISTLLTRDEVETVLESFMLFAQEANLPMPSIEVVGKREFLQKAVNHLAVPVSLYSAEDRLDELVELRNRQWKYIGNVAVYATDDMGYFVDYLKDYYGNNVAEITLYATGDELNGVQEIPEKIGVKGQREYCVLVSDILRDEYGIERSDSRLRRDDISVALSDLTEADFAAFGEFGITVGDKGPSSKLEELFSTKVANSAVMTLAQARMLAAFLAVRWGLAKEDTVAFPTLDALGEYCEQQFGHKAKSIRQLYAKFEQRQGLREVSVGGKHAVPQSSFDQFVEYLEKSRQVEQDYLTTEQFIFEVCAQLGLAAHDGGNYQTIHGIMDELHISGYRVAFSDTGRSSMYRDPQDTEVVVEAYKAAKSKGVE